MIPLLAQLFLQWISPAFSNLRVMCIWQPGDTISSAVSRGLFLFPLWRYTKLSSQQKYLHWQTKSLYWNRTRILAISWIYCVQLQFYHLGAWTRWLSFCRWHFQMHFLDGKFLYFDLNFIGLCSQRVQVMAWCRRGHYLDQNQWCHMASLGHSELHFLAWGREYVT